MNALLKIRLLVLALIATGALVGGSVAVAAVFSGEAVTTSTCLGARTSPDRPQGESWGSFASYSGGDGWTLGS